MVKFVKGNMFESDAEALVNAVNCVGVMGKGLALEFKKRYPKNYANYRTYCNMGKLWPGTLHTTHFEGEPIIINFATKDHWRNPSHIEWIQWGCVELRKFIQNNNITSIAIPALGCGLGGLLWSEVRQVLVETLGDLETDVIIYEPL